MSRLKICLIGCGRIALSHLNAAKQSGLVEVAALVDVSPDRAVDYAARYGITHVYATPEEAAAGCDPDAFDICLPNDLHKDMAIRCVRLKKHVLLEKPMANSVSDCAEMIREGLANMGTLITLEYDFTQVETYTKEKNILFITSSSEFVYSYDGSVLAGVDFEKIGIETDEERHAILVKMPKSEIQSVNIDKNTFKIYSERESLWNPLKLEDYNISLIDFENAAKEKALERGVLERADASARNLVGEFITSLPNTAGYSVEFL